MKKSHKLWGIMILIALLATVYAPETQARPKRDLKKEAVEDLLREGVNCFEAGNYQEAVEYFEAAHKKGNIRATHNLAICYAEGKGVPYKRAVLKKLPRKAMSILKWLLDRCT